MSPQKTPPAPPPHEGPAIDRLLAIMARLRAPDGCPWDREQGHRSLLFHAAAEVYDLVAAIEPGDDQALAAERGDRHRQAGCAAQTAQVRRVFSSASGARHTGASQGS